MVAALLHGSEGYGLHRRLHAERLPDVSTDLPLLALAVDDEERIQARARRRPRRGAEGAGHARAVSGPSADAAELTVLLRTAAIATSWI